MNKRLILTNVAMTTLLVFAGTTIAASATAEAKKGPRKSRLAKYDKNGDGKLGPKEKQAMTRDRVGKIMTRLDVVRKDGQIGPREAKQAGPRMAKLLSVADVNGDQFVTRAELRLALEKLHNSKQWKNKNGKKGKQWKNKNGNKGKQWKNKNGNKSKQWKNKKGQQGKQTTKGKAAAWRQANLPRFAGKLTYAKPTAKAIKTVPSTRVKVLPRSARAKVVAKKPLRFAKSPAKQKVVINKKLGRVIAARGATRL